jgi:thiol-disulfide isomerase/thioredoxin
MRKLFLLAMVLASSFTGMAQTSKYMTFKAEITNPKGDSIFFRDTNGNQKIIKIITAKKKGVFMDTLNVVPGRYYFVHGNELTAVYLKNGFDLKLKLDTKMFDETLVYSGKGSDENNYLAKNLLFQEQTDIQSAFLLAEDDFVKIIEKRRLGELEQIGKEKLDPIFVDLQTKRIQKRYDDSFKDYKQSHDALLVQNKLNNTISPSFDYLNHKGGKTKLDDFVGKYVYIDVWATWCGPCRAEIPFLKKTEEEYHDKNIVFVSISIDTQKDFEKWKTFVADKSLGGVQLFADKDWNSDFMVKYGVTSIPRFILIDPNGKIVKGNASRPSSPELKEELDKLLN